MLDLLEKGHSLIGVVVVDIIGNLALGFLL